MQIVSNQRSSPGRSFNQENELTSSTLFNGDFNLFYPKRCLLCLFNLLLLLLVGLLIYWHELNVSLTKTIISVKVEELDLDSYKARDYNRRGYQAILLE